MRIVVWATALFAVRRICASAEAPPVEMQGCQNVPCITFQTEITAEAGLGAVIPCSYEGNGRITDLRVSRCQPPEQNCTRLISQSKKNSDAHPDFRGQVSLLEPDLSQKNCSISIRNLTEADSGSFQLRVDGVFNGTEVYMVSNLATLSVKANAGARNGARKDAQIAAGPAEQTGQHACPAKHPNATESGTLVLSLRFFDGAKQPAAAAACVCAGERLPWPELKRQLLECSLATAASNHTVSCSVAPATADASGNKTVASSNKTVASGNKGGGNSSEERDPLIHLLETVRKPEVVLAFVTGVLLSTTLSMVVCCLMSRSHRKKLKAYGNIAEVLEMVTSHNGQLMSNGQEVDDDETDGGGAAVAAGNSDVDYSTIKFYALKRAKKVGESQEATETEYAEIKREATREAQGREHNQEAVLIGEADMPKEGEGEDVELCPDVMDVVREI